MISHPHYYTTYADWSKAFNCPVYISADDQEWLCQEPPTPHTLRLIEGPSGTTEEVLPGMTAIKAGGHFPGSLVLHWERKLFIADTIVTVPVGLLLIPFSHIHDLFPSQCFCTVRGALTYQLLNPKQSAHTPHPRMPGQTSYAFQWSIPNMNPLPPDDILKIWKAIEGFEFDTTHGAFLGMDVRDGGLKWRILESMQIQTRVGGWEWHELLDLD